MFTEINSNAYEVISYYIYYGLVDLLGVLFDLGAECLCYQAVPKRGDHHMYSAVQQ